MPFDWQRLSDDDKVAVIDSAKAPMERVRADASAAGGVGRRGLSVGGGTRIVDQHEHRAATVRPSRDR